MRYDKIHYRSIQMSRDPNVPNMTFSSYLFIRNTALFNSPERDIFGTTV